MAEILFRPHYVKHKIFTYSVIVRTPISGKDCGPRYLHSDGSIQDYSISSVLAMKILQSGTKPWIRCRCDFISYLTKSTNHHDNTNIHNGYPYDYQK